MSVRGTGGPRGDALHEMGKDKKRSTCVKCGMLEPNLIKPCPGKTRQRLPQAVAEPAVRQALNPRIQSA